MVFRLPKARSRGGARRGHDYKMLLVRRTAPSRGSSVIDSGLGGRVSLDRVEPGRRPLCWKLEEPPLLEDTSYLLRPFLCGHLWSSQQRPPLNSDGLEPAKRSRPSAEGRDLLPFTNP